MTSESGATGCLSAGPELLRPPGPLPATSIGTDARGEPTKSNKETRGENIDLSWCVHLFQV